jgi:hypothetical protein
MKLEILDTAGRNTSKGWRQTDRQTPEGRPRLPPYGEKRPR